MLDCQPKSAEVRLGILSPGSASAAVANAAMNPARTALARTTRRGVDARFEMAPDIVISFILMMTTLPFVTIARTAQVPIPRHFRCRSIAAIHPMHLRPAACELLKPSPIVRKPEQRHHQQAVMHGAA